MRAYWDGRQLRFRSGNVVRVPEWFLAALPRESLDGELWIGRGRFDQLSGIVRRAVPEDEEWRQVCYMVFELPGAPGTFTDRIAAIEAIMARSGVAWLQAVEQFRLPDASSLQRKLDQVVQGSGEGLMLHRADAAYVSGRSAAILKLTPWLDDEARVIAHVPGKGKLGALRVEMPDGRQFSLGSGLTDAQRRNPLPLGTLVTYRYRALTPNGMPRFPRFLRVHEAF